MSVRFLAGCCLVLLLAGPVAAAETVWLVRHAEQTDPGAEDPELTEAGEAMARHLAVLLRDAGIVAIWSSDYRRTRATAAPLAATLGLEVRLYDPGDLKAFAGELEREPGPCLVVGHSNTTPKLVGLLGGEPGGPIGHREFDRLYLVERRHGQPRTTVLRIP